MPAPRLPASTRTFSPAPGGPRRTEAPASPTRTAGVRAAGQTHLSFAFPPTRPPFARGPSALAAMRAGAAMLQATALPMERTEAWEATNSPVEFRAPHCKWGAPSFKEVRHQKGIVDRRLPALGLAPSGS